MQSQIDGQDQVVGVELVIRQLPSGQIQVTGPIQNKLLCYGLLECAKEVVAQYRPDAKPQLVRAQQLPPNGL